MIWCAQIKEWKAERTQFDLFGSSHYNSLNTAPPFLDGGFPFKCPSGVLWFGFAKWQFRAASDPFDFHERREPHCRICMTISISTTTPHRVAKTLFISAHLLLMWLLFKKYCWAVARCGGQPDRTGLPARGPVVTLHRNTAGQRKSTNTSADSGIYSALGLFIQQ